jgi:RPA family protein
MYTRNKIGRVFIKELEENGVQLEGKKDFIERIEEIDQWQQGFYCLILNGEKIRLKASAEQKFADKIKKVLEKYNFSEQTKNFCLSKICGLTK